jgi:hypothetical protein
LLHLVGDLFEMYDDARTYKTLNLKVPQLFNKFPEF